MKHRKLIEELSAKMQLEKELIEVRQPSIKWILVTKVIQIL
jgi:hypothetical protein